MARRRDDGSGKRKESLRFVLIGPRPHGTLKLSDRLFDGAPAGAARNRLPKDGGARRVGANLSFSRRTAAVLIAAAALSAGLAGVIVGVRDEGWIIGLLGGGIALYGLAWIPVVYRGRLPGGRLRLYPWRRE
jgi:hypothetical protein